jgi:hypothetical protein
MFRHIGTPHCVRLTPEPLMDGDSELFVCSTLDCTFVAAIHVACRTTPGFRLPPRCIEIFVLLGRYAALIGSLLLTFRDNLSCPSLRDKQSLKTGPIGCPETSVTTNQRLVKSQQNEHLQNYIYKAITLSLTLAYLGLCDTQLGLKMFYNVFCHSVSKLYNVCVFLVLKHYLCSSSVIWLHNFESKARLQVMKRTQATDFVAFSI